MSRWLWFGLVAVVLLVAANIAYALTAIGSSRADLSQLDLRNTARFVDLIPTGRSAAIPVRLRLHGGLWLSGFGRRNWFTGVIEAEELEIRDWDWPWNGSDIRLTLRAEREELDPAENIRFAFRDGKAERLEDYDGLRAYRLAWHENSIEIRILGEPGADRFSAIVCYQHGCYADIRIGPNLIGRLDFPDIRTHGGRDYANRLIADVGQRVCGMLVDAICWADR